MSRRQPWQRRSAPTVTIRSWCPRCGGDHPAVECYVIALQELSVPELHRFDQEMREEIALAAMAGELDVVRQMAGVLRGVRSRINRA